MIAAGMQRSGTRWFCNMLVDIVGEVTGSGTRQLRDGYGRPWSPPALPYADLQGPLVEFGGCAASRQFSPTVIRWSSRPIVRRRPRYGSASPTEAPLRRTCCAIRATSSSRRLDQGAKMRAQGALPFRGFRAADELRSRLRAGSSAGSCRSGRNGPRSAGFSRCATRICWPIRAERWPRRSLISQIAAPPEVVDRIVRDYTAANVRDGTIRKALGLDKGASQRPRMVLTPDQERHLRRALEPTLLRMGTSRRRATSGRLDSPTGGLRAAKGRSLNSRDPRLTLSARTTRGETALEQRPEAAMTDPQRGGALAGPGCFRRKQRTQGCHAGTHPFCRSIYCRSVLTSCGCYEGCSSGAGLEDWWCPAISDQAEPRMNIHKNARTTPRSRLLMVRRVLEQKQPATKVAGADFGVSERTVRKWLARWRAGGEAGLNDCSSAPARQRRLPAEQIAAIEALLVAQRLTSPVIAAPPQPAALDRRRRPAASRPRPPRAPRSARAGRALPTRSARRARPHRHQEARQDRRHRPPHHRSPVRHDQPLQRHRLGDPARRRRRRLAPGRHRDPARRAQSPRAIAFLEAGAGLVRAPRRSLAVRDHDRRRQRLSEPRPPQRLVTRRGRAAPGHRSRARATNGKAEALPPDGHARMRLRPRLPIITERAAALPHWLYLYNVHRPHTRPRRTTIDQPIGMNNLLGNDDSLIRQVNRSEIRRLQTLP